MSPPDETSQVEVASRICNVIAEALVLVATWRVTYNVKKVARLLGKDVSLSSLLFRDGASQLRLVFMANRSMIYCPGTLHFG